MNISQTSLGTSFTGSQVARKMVQKVTRATLDAIETPRSSIELGKKLPSPYIMPEPVPSENVVKYGSNYFLKRGHLLFPLQYKSKCVGQIG